LKFQIFAENGGYRPISKCYISATTGYILMKLVSICRKLSEDFIAVLTFNVYACWGGMTFVLNLTLTLWILRYKNFFTSKINSDTIPITH